MNAKEKAPIRSANLTGAAGGMSGETDSNINFTSVGAGRQGRISSLLLCGEENAVPGPELARMAGVNPRVLRLMVDAERLERPICASDRGYFLPDGGNKGIQELRRFVKRQDSRCAANRKVTRSARVALQALEKAPLPGQQNLFDGGGADG